MLILLPILGIVGVWDAFTTVFGTISILGGVSAVSIITGVLLSLTILVLFFMTVEIWTDSGLPEFISFILRSLWLIALAYDLFTSFYGNKELIFNETADKASSLIVITLATILMTGSTIVASWLAKENL